jgi:hypothetical protein
VNAHKEDEHWPHILTILTNGLETGDPVPLGTASHPPTPEMIRRAQVVKELLIAVPRRHLPGGILGKATIPVESILWQIASALTTPVGPVRVAPPSVSGSRPFPHTGHSGRRKKEKKTQAIPSAAEKHSCKRTLRLRMPSWHL